MCKNGDSFLISKFAQRWNADDEIVHSPGQVFILVEGSIIVRPNERVRDLYEIAAITPSKVEGERIVFTTNPAFMYETLEECRILTLNGTLEDVGIKGSDVALFYRVTGERLTMSPPPPAPGAPTPPPAEEPVIKKAEISLLERSAMYTHATKPAMPAVMPKDRRCMTPPPVTTPSNGGGIDGMSLNDLALGAAVAIYQANVDGGYVQPTIPAPTAATPAAAPEVPGPTPSRKLTWEFRSPGTMETDAEPIVPTVAKTSVAPPTVKGYGHRGLPEPSVHFNGKGAVSDTVAVPPSVRPAGGQ